MGPRCPPQVLRDDRCRHHRPEGQVRILPSSHPQVHLCQLQGRCCQGCRPPSHGSEERSCCRQLEDGQSLRKGSWLLQAGRKAKAVKKPKAKKPAAKKPKAKKATKKPAAKKAAKPAAKKPAAKKPAAKKAAKKPAAKKPAIRLPRSKSEMN